MTIYSLKNRLRALLPISLKANLKRLVANEFSGRIIAAVYRNRVPYRGSRIVIERPRMRFRIAAQLFWRFYERIEMDQIDAYLLPDLDVVELGSSLGVGTVLIARRLARGRRVVAIEADPTICAIAMKNYTLNGVADRITLISAAVGCPRGRARFLRSENTDGGRIADQKEEDDSYEVDILTLSDILEREGIDEFALVADIEGAEAGIILDDTDAIRKCRRIFIELHDTRYKGRSYTQDELVHLIEGAGFKAVDRYRASVVFDREISLTGAAP